MELVTADNFVRAETTRMFEGAVLAHTGGALSRWLHYRSPMPIDQQDVIRMNRDTLYSGCVVDLANGATLTLPDTSGRYLSVMIVNEDHFINRVYHEAGTHELTIEEHGTRFVSPMMRIFVDPTDEADVKAVNALQDAVVVEAGADGPYTHPDYDEPSRKKVFDAVATLGEGLPNDRMFGAKADVDPVRHLVGTAIGWGGLPMTEAFYMIESEQREMGHFQLSLRDVPVDGFWSMTIYNRDGFMEPNPYDSYSANNLTSVADSDGSVTLDFAPADDGFTNHLYVMEGWNFIFRLYQPRASVLDGSWKLPEIVRVG